MRNSGRVGLLLTIKAAPLIERRFKGLGKEPAQFYHPYWIEVGVPLLVYQGWSVRETVKDGWTLTHPGEPLIIEDHINGNKANLSFLTLAGIGTPDGVTFGVSTPVSDPFVSQIAGMLAEASKDFIKKNLL